MRLILILIILIAAVFAVTRINDCTTGSPEGGNTAPDDQGIIAPDFILKSLDGQTISLSELRGQPVLLNFWTTWCGYCRDEMPHFQQLYEDPAWLARDLVILAVDVKEPESMAREFMTNNGYSFTVLLDNSGEVAVSYNVPGFPVTFIIDKDGIIRNNRVGAFSSKAHIEQFITDSIDED